MVIKNDLHCWTESTYVIVLVHVYLGIVELHGIICGQGHTQTFVQELSERIFGVLQEEAVVAEWRHRYWHLGQVVQVLQHGALRGG